MRPRLPRPAELLSIASVKVQNFRAIVAETLSLGDLTALIGANGSGKTTFLLALERFFADRTRLIEPADFNHGKRTLRITVAFRDPSTGKGFKMARTWRRKGESVETPKYSWGKKSSADCKRYLKESVRVIYVPAEHETDADGEDKKSTLLEKMIDDALRKKASLSADKDALQKKFEEEYGERLEEIKGRINGKLSGECGVGYAPGTRVILGFAEPEVKIGTSLKVLDLDSEREVEHKYVGHGTKRAFYMSALEVISEVSDDGDKKDGENGESGKGGEGDGRPDPLTMVVIDEPELHQHPQRQRVLLEALRSLSRRDSHQVVYSTHSPHFVSLKTPMSVRKVIRGGGGVRVHDGRGIGEAQVRGAVISAMEEAVFAKGAILVEGHTDAVALGAVLRKATHRVDGKSQSAMETLIKREVAIAECGGKPNVPRFCAVLDSLGIKKFVVWDGDGHHRDKRKKDETRERNTDIIGALGLDPGFLGRIESSGGTDCVVGDACACFGVDAPTYLAGCFGMGHKGELEAAIRDGKDLGARLDRPALEKTGFFRDAVPAILERLAKEGDGGKDRRAPQKPARGQA